MKMGFEILKYTDALDLKKFYQRLWKDQHVPFCIKRKDGVLLLMNNDFKSYSFWSYGNKKISNDIDMPNIGGEMPEMMKVPKYSYRRLFEDHRINEGDFVVESWAPIENLFNKPEQYFKEPSQIKVNYRRNVCHQKQREKELPSKAER